VDFVERVGKIIHCKLRFGLCVFFFFCGGGGVGEMGWLFVGFFRGEKKNGLLI
jgi:hypothetical protein